MRDAIFTRLGSSDVFAVTADRPSHKATPPRQLNPSTTSAVASHDPKQTTLKAARVVKAGSAARRVELPSGPSSTETLELFNQTLEDIFEKVDTTEGGRGNTSISYDDEELLTRDELSDLSRATTDLSNLGLLKSIKSSQIVRLLDVLEKQIAQGESIDINEDDNERNSSNVQNILKALDAVSISLQILGAPDMPKEIYREESIDVIINFVKYHTFHNVFVFFDASYYQIHRGEKELQPDGAAAENHDNDTENRTPTKKGKKGASAKSAQTPGKRMSLGGGLNGKEIPKPARKINDLLSGILTQLAHLLFTIHLPDATVLQLTSLGTAALTVDGVDLIQAKAVDMVVAAFKQYPEHRGLILDNLLLALLKLPTSGRNLRRYMLPEDDTKSVQVLSAMLMKCVQMSVTFDNGSVGGTSTALVLTDGSEKTEKGYGPAFQWSHYFWKELLRGWHSARAQEIDIKSLMQNLVSDLLTTLNMPEWPAASLMLVSLCAQLLSKYGINSSEIRLRELSMDFLGQVAARVKSDTLLCEKEKLWSELFSPGEGDADVENDSLSPEMLTAFEMAQQDAADSRAGVADAANIEVTESGSTDALVLESMLLRYIRQNEVKNKTRTESGSAFTFVLAQLSRESERKNVGFRVGGVGPGGDRATYKSLAKVIKNSAVDSPFTDFIDGGVLLSRPLAIRLFRTLQQQLPLARQRHILVERLLGALEDTAITVRAAAVRALSQVVDADPRILEWETVQASVQRRMSDNGTMVRSAIIDLLGKHIVNDARIAERYYESIVERISDVGVSVRKRVINILHDCLRTGNTLDSKHNIEALRFLAFRILDDDVGIQDLIVKIFRELWFSKPPVSRNSRKETSADATDPVRERAEQLVAVLWEVYCGVSRVGYAKLPLLSTFPIVAILRRVVFPSEEEGAGAEGASNGDASETVTTARRICASILDGMLAQEEEVIEDGDDNTDVGGKTPNSSSDMTQFPKAVRYALGLHVFCATDPRLCVAEENPMHFATSLQPYFKRNENTPANSLQLQCCISVVDAVVKESGAISLATATEIEKDLRFLLLRNTYHGVLYYASRCICSVAETMMGNVSTVATGSLQICRRFVKLLAEVAEKESLSLGERAHVSRALFVLGHLGRFGADTLELSREVAVAPEALLTLFRTFLQRTGNQDEFDLKRRALQACGFLFVSRPALMLCPNGGFGKGSMDGIMRAALGKDAERNLKEQALLNLDEYLREEEIRTLIQMSDDPNAQQGGGNATQKANANAAAIAGTGGALSRAKRRRAAEAKRAEGGEKDTTGIGFQTVNGEHDNSLANGVAQRYWSFVLELCVDPEPSVRLKALHLAEVVLRQGLVHPMSCFPPLIALQADPVLTSKKLAMRLLRQQHGKYPDFFDHQLGAGLGLLFEFCKRLQSLARRAARKGNTQAEPKVASAEVVNQGFTNIYKLVNGTRASRFKFLLALLRRYEGKTSGSDVTYLCFLASAIAALPFTMSDEVLFVIFHLNRVISLRASTLQDSLKERVANEKETLGTNSEVSVDLKENIELSLSASIMLSLKRHLKLTYDLTDQRTQAYNPAEPLKSAEAFRKDEDASALDLSWCDPLASATLASCTAQADLFATLMQSDANDYGEYAGTGKKRARKKKRSTFAVNDDDSDEDDDSDADDEPFSPLPKTATLASPRSARKGKRRNDDSATPTPRKKLAL